MGTIKPILEIGKPFLWRVSNRWDGRESQEGRDICYWWPICIVVPQKPTQHYKAIILQLKKKKEKKKKEESMIYAPNICLF